MPGTGFGGVLANLMNPGLDQQVAASITPNPSPLAQQDQKPVPPVPGAPSNPAPGQAPPQVTQPDPALAQTNQNLMRAWQVAQASDSFNQGLQRIAAGYGTAQQQASKQAALAGGGAQGGGGQGYLDMVGKMQGIDREQTDQTEHARFMANAGVLAKILYPNDPDGLAKATEVMNNKGMLEQQGQVAASNATQTSTIKDWNAGRSALTSSLKQANPNMSDADIAKAVDARMPPDLLMSGVGGNPEDAAYYQYAAQERAAGRAPMDPIAWKAQHTTATAETMQKQKEVIATQGNFPAAQQTYSEQIGHVKDLLNNPDGYKELLGFRGAITPTTQLSDAGKRAWKDYQTIMAGQFGSAVQDFPGSRISTKELVADAPSKSTMGLMLDPSTFQKNTEDYLQTLLGHNANLFGKAHQLSDPSLSDAEYDKYANQIYKAGGDMGPAAVNRAPPAKIGSPADALTLPAGKSFVLPDGTKGYAVKTPLDIKMLPRGAKFVIPGGPDAGQIDTAP